MSTPKLELVALTKEYDSGSIPAVDGIDLSVSPGETLALLGPSGCGKSTTLNMIVGLETPTSGDIHIDGLSVLNQPPGKRNVGLVFQDYAVFTHMSVLENLAFGLAVRGVPKCDIRRAVEEVAELLDMHDRLHVRARDLGGSELQRVAIGRTLVTRPSVLLLDEPLSNLEANARLAMRRELRRLQRETGLTIVYVTHDQIEALSLADRIVVMNHGKIQQIERSAVIYDRPAHVFVARFLGTPPMNLLRGELVRDANRLQFRSDLFSITLPNLDALGPAPRRHLPVMLGIRAELLSVVPVGEALWSGRVTIAEPRGPQAVLTVTAGEASVCVVVPAATALPIGAHVGLCLDPNDCLVFDYESGHRIALSEDPQS